MKKNVLVCWSGGKNSTRAVIEYHNRGYKVTALCYIPMFTDLIPLIDKEHYEFILKTAEYFRSLGILVEFVKGITYYDWFSCILKKGKYKGKVQGLPCFMRGHCGFAKDSKIKSINKFFNVNSDKYSIIDIGLCADEYDRKKLKGKERSILQEFGILDRDCFYWCRDNNLLSPRYARSGRDGCLLCPQAKSFERVLFFQQYPEAFDLVLQLQRLQKDKCPHYPLRGKHWFIENEEFICGNGSQLSAISDCVIY